jgi:hypothetical protein
MWPNNGQEFGMVFIKSIDLSSRSSASQNLVTDPGQLKRHRSADPTAAVQADMAVTKPARGAGLERHESSFGGLVPVWPESPEAATLTD